MNLRNRKLFTMGLLFFFLNIGIGANSVSGIYSIPRNSVKFEKKSQYSILPVGWSKKGNAAFVIIDRDHNNLSMLIVDAVMDRVLWTSSQQSLSNSSPAAVWSKNSDLFSENLSQWGIIPDENPQYGGLQFSIGGDDFKLYSEETPLAGNRGIASMSLKIESKLRGSKSLFKYVENPDQGRALLAFYALGYFQSPWEKRIAVLSLSDFFSSESGEISELKFSGAHLAIGYMKTESTDTMLIDAVLSGQFYNARTLLSNGADPDITVPTGDPLILMAAKQNNWDLVFLLIDYKADVAVIDGDMRTLLHYGAEQGGLEVVRKLILFGLNKNFKDRNGKTALSLARKNNFIDVVNLLK